MSYLPTGTVAIGTPKIKLVMSLPEFDNFKRCLKEGLQGTHGKGGLILSQKVMTVPQNHNSSYRDIRVYFRLFILSIAMKPAAISSKVIDWLYSIKV